MSLVPCCASDRKPVEPELQVPARLVPLKLYVSVQLKADVSTQLEDARGIRAGDLSERGTDVLGVVV